MILRWLIAVALLPGMTMGVIPGVLLWVFRGTRWAWAPASAVSVRFWVAAVVGAAGLALGVWTASLFARFGDGTAAPWDPPRRFVVRGPYRHVRNPMISAVFAVLAAEAIGLASWPVFAWFVVFVVANCLYIPLVEEKGLARRFGETYLAYKRRAPRWLPRISPIEDPGVAS